MGWGVGLGGSGWMSTEKLSFCENSFFFGGGGSDRGKGGRGVARFGVGG